MGHQQEDQYTYRREKLPESLFKEITAEKSEENGYLDQRSPKNLKEKELKEFTERNYNQTVKSKSKENMLKAKEKGNFSSTRNCHETISGSLSGNLEGQREWSDNIQNAKRKNC